MHQPILQHVRATSPVSMTTESGSSHPSLPDSGWSRSVQHGWRRSRDGTIPKSPSNNSNEILVSRCQFDETAPGFSRHGTRHDDEYDPDETVPKMVDWDDAACDSASRLLETGLPSDFHCDTVRPASVSVRPKKAAPEPDSVAGYRASARQPWHAGVHSTTALEPVDQAGVRSSAAPELVDPAGVHTSLSRKDTQTHIDAAAPVNEHVDRKPVPKPRSKVNLSMNTARAHDSIHSEADSGICSEQATDSGTGLVSRKLCHDIAYSLSVACSDEELQQVVKALTCDRIIKRAPADDDVNVKSDIASLLFHFINNAQSPWTDVCHKFNMAALNTAHRVVQNHLKLAHITAAAT